MPQKLLRACAAPAALAVVGAIVAVAPAAHPSAAHAPFRVGGPPAPAPPPAHPPPPHAAGTPPDPAAGDVAIARRRLNVVAGRRALVAGRVVGAATGRNVALQRRSRGRWHTIDRD